MASRRRARPYTNFQVFNCLAFLIVLRQPPEPVVPDRRALRDRLHGVRDRFAAESGVDASTALAAHLSEVLTELMPERLGLYWPLRSEFNAASACLGYKNFDDLALALPFAVKSPKQMHYREWNRVPPTGRDECGIPSPDGPPVEPDVVLVPCLGYTSSGFRLGYGGGYYDRWLAAHPHVTAIGVAWSACEVNEAEFVPQAHDQPLMLIVTERGVVSG